MFFQARERVPLITFAEQCLGKGRSHGGSVRWDDCPACRNYREDSGKLSVMGGTPHLFRCFACDAKGDVTEFARHWFDLPEGPAGCKQAAEKLLGIADHWGNKPPKVRTETPQDGEKKRDIRPFLKALLDSNIEPDKAVFTYLSDRGFSSESLAWLWEAGLFRTLPDDPDVAHGLILDLLGGNRQALLDTGLSKIRGGAISYPAIAFKPLIFIFPGATSAEFRAIHPLKKMKNGKLPPKLLRYGSTDQPWVIPGAGSSKTTFITEGLMDAVSLRMLQRAKGTDPSRVIAIPGVKSWKDTWNGLIETERVAIAFDGDQAGVAAGLELEGKLNQTSLGRFWAQSIASRLPEGKDINDLLLSKQS